MKNKKVSLAVLITCFNRRDTTLSCLASLFQSKLPPFAGFDVYLVDDGSVDGTSESITINYPSVKIIQGTGSLFWSGGMRLAWSVAAKNNYDYYLWLNDDCEIFENSLNILISAGQKKNGSSIICSTMTSKSTGEITYGGRLMTESKLIEPKGLLSKCDLINGNCVLVPRKIFLKIGAIDPIFVHAIGDFDYGLRAKKAGFQSYIAPKVIGYCNLNKIYPMWFSIDVSVLERLKSLYSHKCYAQPVLYFIYANRHLGFLTAFKHLLYLHLRVLYPKLLCKI